MASLAVKGLTLENTNKISEKTGYAVGSIKLCLGGSYQRKYLHIKHMCMHICVGDQIWENVHSLHIRFSHLEIHENHREWGTRLKLSGMIKEYYSTIPEYFTSICHS